jgi:hypothetical protein
VSDQLTLDTGGDRRPSKMDYYRLLPQGVVPTAFEHLEQGGDTLLIKLYRRGQRQTPKHLKLIRRQIQMGRGSVSAICIFLGDNPHQRVLEIWELGVEPRRWATDVDGIRQWIFNWFTARERRA